MKQRTKTLAIINDQSILLIENGDRLVPIKPICDALGIDAKAQRSKIQDDVFLSSTGVLSTSVAGDGKEREMFCLPFKYVFGWLFTINPANVKEEAREAVLNYRAQCYDALYDHFTAYADFNNDRIKVVESKVEAVEKIREEFNASKKRLDKAKQELNDVRSITFEMWKANGRQLEMFDQDNNQDD